MKVEIVEITPSMASDMLSRNNTNRPITKNNLEKLVKEFKEGNFKLTGESIKISKDNYVIDGQHRLMACTITGISFKTLVVSGLDNAVFDVIDQGKPRSLADLLSIKGVKNSVLHAAGVTLLYAYELNGIPRNVGFKLLTKAELLEFAETKPDFYYSVSEVTKMEFLNKAMSPAYNAFLHYVFSCKDSELAKDFFANVETGVNLDANSPEFVLRKRLIDNQCSNAKESLLSLSAYFIKAWNLKRKGGTCKFLKWVQVGSNQEDFPKIL